MARKAADLSGFCQRGAATKQFDMRYYNVDILKAAPASPEFMRAAFRRLSLAARRNRRFCGCDCRPW